MTSPLQLDPLTLSGCFAYLDCDVPAGMTLTARGSQQTCPKADHREIVGASTRGRHWCVAPESHPCGRSWGRIGRSAGAAPARWGACGGSCSTAKVAGAACSVHWMGTAAANEMSAQPDPVGRSDPGDALRVTVYRSRYGWRVGFVRRKPATVVAAGLRGGQTG
jgi:hypothetical protein